MPPERGGASARWRHWTVDPCWAQVAAALHFVRPARVEREALNHRCQEHPEQAAAVQRTCLFEVRRLRHRRETFAFRKVEQRRAIALLTEMRRAGWGASPPQISRT